MTELTPEEMEEYEEQLQDTDVTALLIQQNALLSAILEELQDGSARSESEIQGFECEHCGQVVQGENMQSHAEGHKLPPGMEPEDIFTEV